MATCILYYRENVLLETGQPRRNREEFFSVCFALDRDGPGMSNLMKLDSLPRVGSSAAGSSADGQTRKVLAVGPFWADVSRLARPGARTRTR